MYCMLEPRAINDCLLAFVRSSLARMHIYIHTCILFVRGGRAAPTYMQTYDEVGTHSLLKPFKHSSDRPFILYHV